MSDIFEAISLILEHFQGKFLYRKGETYHIIMKINIRKEYKILH